MNDKIKIGVSSCLLGNLVYHDGGHKRQRFLTDILSEFVDYIPICPEMAIGLGTPRPTMHLVGSTFQPKMALVKDHSTEYTQELQSFALSKTKELTDISGYLLKSKSPSCGMERVRVYNEAGEFMNNNGIGIYARVLMHAWPSLPVEEEGRLNDPVLRENFLERVYMYHRWQAMLKQGLSMSALVDFHTRHKFLLMSRSSEALYHLGRIIANEDHMSVEALANEYFVETFKLVRIKPNRLTHTNVLMHIMGFLKKQIDTQEKHNILEVIESYRKGYTPLITPLTLLKHLFKKYPNHYIQRQYYLEPYPESLMLRSTVM